MKWYVSRQNYWGVDDPLVVEIAAGGLDYANADMLVAKYGCLGEGDTFTDPREAAEAAIEVRNQWNMDLVKEGSSDRCRVEHGFTAGSTVPFQEYPDDDQLKEWVEKAWEALEKCPICGDPMPDEGQRWFLLWWPDEKYCSEQCCDKAEKSYRDTGEQE